MQDGVEDGCRGRACERQPTCRHLVQHDAQGKEVRAGVKIFTQRLLGGHVGHRPQCRPRTRQVLFCGSGRNLRVFSFFRRSTPHALDLREAEVEDLRFPPFGHEDVRGLDIPMNDPLGVGRIQSIRELDADLQELLRLEGLPGDAVLERLALQKLHGDEGLTLVLVYVVDGADVSVIEGGSGLGFTPEAFLSLVVGEQPHRQELQRDGSVEARVLGFVDDTHTPAAELLDDPVVGDGLADHQLTQSTGTRRFSSSNQLRTTLNWDGGGGSSASRSIRKRWPSGVMS